MPGSRDVRVYPQTIVFGVCAQVDPDLKNRLLHDNGQFIHSIGWLPASPSPYPYGKSGPSQPANPVELLIFMGNCSFERGQV
jgi:hypothetical protein